MIDNELYGRGVATLVAAWQEYADGASGGELLRINGVTIAVFPSEPERAVYNNTLFAAGLGPTERATAIDAMEAVYIAAAVEHYAARIHESDEDMQVELRRRGYAVAESSRAMGMRLDRTSLPLGEVELASADWHEHLRVLGLPSDFLNGADPSAFRVLVGRLDGEDVATAMAFDHDGDCGIFNVSAVETARRRGFGTALTARLVRDGAERGCSTASLQSTPMAERLYTAVGFEDLGRILEYTREPRAAGDRADGRTRRAGRFDPSTLPVPASELEAMHA